MAARPGTNLTGEIGRRGFRLASWIDGTAKAFLVLGVAGMVLALAAALTADDSADTAGLFAVALCVGIGTWLQFCSCQL